MRISYQIAGRSVAAVALLLSWLVMPAVRGADHNDPNAINSIFADIPPSAADLYDLFGFPADDRTDGEKVVVALTFAPVPRTGIFDTDLLYRLKLDPDARSVPPRTDDFDLDDLLDYAGAAKDKYLELEAAEVRVSFEQPDRAKVSFIGFPSGTVTTTVATNEAERIETPDGHTVRIFIGGRDDAFFNDLPGFFRSINYAPQFYDVPLAQAEARELPIPKTLIELEGNTLFNFDPANPRHGRGVKEDLPPAPWGWRGDRFARDADGNFRFVYSGRDAQAFFNVNAIVLELPLAFLTTSAATERVVNAWGESWVLKAASKVEAVPDEDRSPFRRFWDGLTALFSPPDELAEELKRYKLVDTDGVPFADAALSERRDEDQRGADNRALVRTFVRRLGHLGWGFGPSISALGLGTCFDHDDAPVSIHRTYDLATTAFPRVKECLFQHLNMPDGSWNPRGLDIPRKRLFEVFVPNVCAIDMDTTGTWPYGRRLEDQVATRFVAIFLDMDTGCGGGPCTLETLADQALWDSAPIVPKTPPNPLANDKEFLDHFPYLAEPW